MIDPIPAILISAGVGAAFVLGALVGHVTARWGLNRDRERVELRKDAAVEAAMGTAFELQRVSGDVPAVEIQQYDWETEPPRAVPDQWSPAAKARYLR